MIKRTVTIVRPSTNIDWYRPTNKSLRETVERNTITISPDGLIMTVVTLISESDKENLDQMPEIISELSDIEAYNSAHGITVTRTIEII
jgi:hypothetical protein